MAQPATSGDTTATATIKTTATVAEIHEATTASLAPLEDEADAEDDVKILILGEVVGLDIDSPNKAPFPDLEALTTATLGGNVVDLTTVGQTLEMTVKQVEDQVETPPDLALVFAGFSDERKDTKDTDQRDALRQIISLLRDMNENITIFLIPSSTNVGAITSANLRLAASELNANYVSIGTEVGGQPYVDALEAVKEELVESAQQPDDTGEAPAASAAPSNSVVIRGNQLEVPESSESTAPLDYEQRRTNLQEELEKVAGQAGEAVMMLPSLDDTATTAFVDAASTGTAGTVTKRGVEAKDESIKMKSLPAVKAFRPQIPVPRNEVEVKEPALSR